LPLATIAAAAYWILRPEDHRRWASVFQPPFENGNRSKKPQVQLEKPLRVRNFDSEELE